MVAGRAKQKPPGAWNWGVCIVFTWRGRHCVSVESTKENSGVRSFVVGVVVNGTKRRGVVTQIKTKTKESSMGTKTKGCTVPWFFFSRACFCVPFLHQKWSLFSVSVTMECATPPTRRHDCTCFLRFSIGCGFPLLSLSLSQHPHAHQVIDPRVPFQPYTHTHAGLCFFAFRRSRP
jgi:hypothetical protein